MTAELTIGRAVPTEVFESSPASSYDVVRAHACRPIEVSVWAHAPDLPGEFPGRL